MGPQVRGKSPEPWPFCGHWPCTGPSAGCIFLCVPRKPQAQKHQDLCLVFLRKWWHTLLVGRPWMETAFVSRHLGFDICGTQQAGGTPAVNLGVQHAFWKKTSQHPGLGCDGKVSHRARGGGKSRRQDNFVHETAGQDFQRSRYCRLLLWSQRESRQELNGSKGVRGEGRNILGSFVSTEIGSHSKWPKPRFRIYQIGHTTCLSLIYLFSYISIHYLSIIYLPTDLWKGKVHPHSLGGEGIGQILKSVPLASGCS